MDDRGDKIVTLARELLRSDVMVEPEEPSLKINMSFRILCFATILTAVASSAVTEWVSHERRPITHYEKVELDALVFYAARQNKLDEQALRDEVRGAFHVTDFNSLTEHQFASVRRYLQDKAQ